MLKTPTNGIFSPTLNNVQSGDTLVYDNYTSNWINIPSSGGALILVEGETTWQQVYNALAEGIPVLCPYAEDAAHAYCDYVTAAIAATEEFGVFVMSQNYSTDDPMYVAETADGVLTFNNQQPDQ